MHNPFDHVKVLVFYRPGRANCGHCCSRAQLDPHHASLTRILDDGLRLLPRVPESVLTLGMIDLDQGIDEDYLEVVRAMERGTAIKLPPGQDRTSMSIDMRAEIFDGVAQPGHARFGELHYYDMQTY
jgi:hypothetical protein